jgi:hypothetical protein
MRSLRKALVLAGVVAPLTLLGCGDSGSSGGGNGDAGSVCSECDVQNAAAIQACQEFYNQEFYNVCLIEDAGSPEDCAVGARQRCGA